MNTQVMVNGHYVNVKQENVSSLCICIYLLCVFLFCKTKYGEVRLMLLFLFHLHLNTVLYIKRWLASSDTDKPRTGS